MYEDINLYDETLKKLNKLNKSFDNVIAIYNNKYEINKEDFIKASKEINYYNGYGAPDIDLSLTILGDDFVLVRHEYDGSEWWHNVSLKAPSTIKNISKEDLYE